MVRHPGSGFLASSLATAELQCFIYQAFSPEEVLQEPAARDALEELAAGLPQPLVVALSDGERVPQKVLSKALDQSAADNVFLDSSSSRICKLTCNSWLCRGPVHACMLCRIQVRTLSCGAREAAECALAGCPSAVPSMRRRIGCFYRPRLSLCLQWRQDVAAQRAVRHSFRRGSGRRAEGRKREGRAASSQTGRRTGQRPSQP